MNSLSKYYGNTAELRINNIAGSINIFVDTEFAEHLKKDDIIQISTINDDDREKPHVPSWVREAKLYFDDKHREDIYKWLVNMDFKVISTFFNHEVMCVFLELDEVDGDDVIENIIMDADIDK
jgi:hypothetical protein